MMVFRASFAALLLVVAMLTTNPANALDMGVAGPPQSLGRTRDYDKIFSTLAASGVTVFFPTFQTVEAPAAKSLGFETDFVPPCKAGDAAFAAARKHGIRLIVPADLLYPKDGSLPGMDDDPLVKLIACAGRDAIHGVLSFDEPADVSGVSEQAAAAVQARVKQVDPTLPVLMVHAPIVLDKPQFASEAQRASYLQRVKAYSRHADVVGFDIYPVTPQLAQIGSPASNGAIVSHDAAFRDYMAWLKREIPDRKYMMVLQGFAYADQYDAALLAQVPAEMRALARAPTTDEALEMARISADGGASLLVWWGTSFQKDEQTPAWRGVLATIAALRGRR